MSNFEFDVECKRVVNAKSDLRSHRFLEAGGLGGNGVSTNRQLIESIKSISGRHSFPGKAGGGILGLHIRTGDHGSGLVLNRTADGARVLAQCHRRKHEDGTKQEHEANKILLHSSSELWG